MGGVVICAHCGRAGHTRGQCDLAIGHGIHRDPFLLPEVIVTIEDGRPRVADAPRRCEGCDAPTIVTVEGAVLDDRPRFRGRPHLCLQDRKSA